MLTPLVSDAARPLKRTLHLETLKLLDGEHTQFDLQVAAPAVLRHVCVRQFSAEARIIGAKKKTGILVVLVFEVDPDASPIARKFYVLPFGVTANGAAIADMMFAGIGTLPNGAPVAVYEMSPSVVTP